MAEYGKRRNPEARLQAITMKLLDSGYYDIGSDEGRRHWPRSPSTSMDTIDAEGARIRRDRICVALGGSSREGYGGFLMY